MPEPVALCGILARACIRGMIWFLDSSYRVYA